MIPISTQINFNLCFQNNTTKIFAIPNQRFCSSESSNSNTCSHTHDDLPDPTMDNPFLKEKRQCILCRYQITADYKVHFFYIVNFKFEIIICKILECSIIITVHFTIYWANV